MSEKHLDYHGLALFWERIKSKLTLKADKTDLDLKADKTAVPTKTSQLTNDSGYLTRVVSDDLPTDVKASLKRADTALQSESDPTVPAWAKAATKPSYTAAEVGAPTLEYAESTYAKKTDITSVYKYKGSKATFAELPSDASVGDVWDVKADGMNYGWTGTAWDALGTQFAVESITAEEINALMDAE